VYATRRGVDIGTVVLCQQAVRGGRVGDGDSGAPVFGAYSNGSDYVWAYGVLWGGGPVSGAPQLNEIYYSDFYNIFEEFTAAHPSGGAGFCLFSCGP
jgi:hypothetical protein